MNRDKEIIKTSYIAIIVNFILACFKAVVGVLANSIAIILDAVNNITDAASSLITIIGTRLASKSPDARHPFGHGRIEYMSAIIISAIILYAGVTSLFESVKKILDPVQPQYSTVTLIIVFTAVVTKVLLGRYVRKKGEQLSSDSLVVSGEDALMDAVISASTLAAAFAYMVFRVSIEAFLGVIIALLIIKSAVEGLGDTVSKILGESVDKKTGNLIRKTINEFDEVKGCYDLVMNNYGPEKILGSVHVEVREDMTAREIDRLERKIQEKVFAVHGIILTGISVYSLNTSDTVAMQIRQEIRNMVFENPHVLEMHGFYLDEDAARITFDIVMSFEARDRNGEYLQILAKVKEKYPQYEVIIALDSDFSER